MSIYRRSGASSASDTFMMFFATRAFPSSRALGLTCPSSSSPRSDLPIITPRATAIGSPIIPVPGIPTPMAFLMILALKLQSIDSICEASSIAASSRARAAARATATGSVQPVAGTISRFNSFKMLSFSDSFIVKKFIHCNNSETKLACAVMPRAASSSFLVISGALGECLWRGM